MSTRVLFVGATIGFTIASALCASATSLGAMIVFRVMQGFLGGAMIPTVFPVVYTVFPPRQLAVVMVVISLILNLSSTVGPTRRRLSDRHLFVALAVSRQHRARRLCRGVGVDADRCRQAELVAAARLRPARPYPDGAIPRRPRIRARGRRALGLVFRHYDPRRRRSSPRSRPALFFWRVLTYRQPIVDLRAFRIRNFAMGSLYTFVVGIGLYCGTYVVPLFLAEVRGFSSLQIGLTVVVTGWRRWSYRRSPRYRAQDRSADHAGDRACASL